MEIKVRHPLLHFIGITILTAVYFYFFFCFLTAYYSPSRGTVMQIDLIGEAKIEFWLLIITFPFVLNSLIVMWRITKGGKYETSKT